MLTLKWNNLQKQQNRQILRKYGLSTHGGLIIDILLVSVQNVYTCMFFLSFL